MIDVVYWDSDCFLGWLLSEPDKRDRCAEVLQDAEAGKLLIVTSALTLAEVLALRYRPRIPDAERDLVVNFFKNEWILVRPLTRPLAEQAREFVWVHSVRPKDACHVATALSAGVRYMHTFDVDLIGNSGKVGGNPPLLISKPFVAQPGLLLGGGARDEGEAAE